MTIWYVKPEIWIFQLKKNVKGGAYTIPFTRADLPSIKNDIRKIFERIKNTEVPTLRNNDFCTAICFFGKNLKPGTDKTLCSYYHEEIKRVGLNQVLLNEGNVKGLTEYGDGGGRKSTQTP
jgi:hypothetical protein